MTEVEKIAYAKSFVDRLANGINPLDNTPIPDGDIVNNVRLSRCFFYVSEILQREIDRQSKKETRETRTRRRSFSLTPEQIQSIECVSYPVSVSTLLRNINRAAGAEIAENRMVALRYRKVTQWLLDIGMIEYREWDDGRWRRFPTSEGEAIGITWQEWTKYNRCKPVILLSESAQRFIVDNIDAVIATKLKKDKATDDTDMQENED